MLLQSQQNGELQTLLERGRREVEVLEEKQRVLLEQLDLVTQREGELRDETTRMEKSLAMAMHDLKEVSNVFALYTVLSNKFLFFLLTRSNAIVKNAF